MKLHKLLWMSSCLLLISCLGEDDTGDTDLSAPKIRANDNLSVIQPDHFMRTTTDDTEIPLAFTVEDDNGIQEIKIESHSGFDGHTHGKSMAPKNSRFKLFSYFELIGNENIQNSKRFIRSSEDQKNIYLDERNTQIDFNDLILAGPYHFSIQATDVAGNQTRYQDNSTYHTTLYINRSYAPQVDISSIDIPGKNISGKIIRNLSHSASSDIAFLWIYIEQPNPNNQAQEGTIIREWIWGKSNWPHQFRPNEGQPLPDTKQLDLGTLLENATDFYSNLSGNKFCIWAEDTIGNITVKKLPIN
ncbi:DUF4625 domain-containing protein [Aquimarina celericrescens]|uniref:DUF4625 domain-containing protein n=1 Tax=Aquimarina celericrescens TaxID=1964542 RepID=A0ABW5ASL9_9FLAO|nr:DUF4625 domain-containing protein [Aquimarina celericrescens]